MISRHLITASLLVIPLMASSASERIIVSLKDFTSTELKAAGIEVPSRTTVTIKALGGGGDRGWTYKSDEMFAYGWIINADTRRLVWKMDVDNTRRSRDDREFDGQITLEPGRYEVYFAAATFAYHSTFSHFNLNINHREKPLFGSLRDGGKNVFSIFKGIWSDDIEKEWNKRAPQWGIELLVDEARARSIASFDPPRALPNTVLQATGVGENSLVRTGFRLSEPTTLLVYAVGEGRGGDDMFDYGWIIDAVSRKRVWEMTWRNSSRAGGADKNIESTSELKLGTGDYIAYFVSDGSHSPLDWNAAPPHDPFYWGMTISTKTEAEARNVTTYKPAENQNVIVQLTRVRDNEYRTEGFTLKEDTPVRIYAFGERSGSRRMADYAVITDARTRNKVWQMDVDRTLHAGGAQKNRYIDEVVTLPKGNYIVSYTSDDSHSFESWNADPPFDPENYGITVMGAGPGFSKSVVTTYVEERDKNIIAQIVRVGDDERKQETFKLDRTTRVRIYAIGEGQNRKMYDYGWIEDAKSGRVVWEMTYSMTFHAGGGRKNRMVNTTFLLDKGEYRLYYASDDSHSFNRWNVDPPDDPTYWGITLYRDE